MTQRGWIGRGGLWVWLCLALTAGCGGNGAGTADGGDATGGHPDVAAPTDAVNDVGTAADASDEDRPAEGETGPDGDQPDNTTDTDTGPNIVNGEGGGDSADAATDGEPDDATEAGAETGSDSSDVEATGTETADDACPRPNGSDGGSDACVRPHRLLILHGGGDDDVRAGLDAAGAFDEVVALDARDGVPALADLQAYEAILFYWNTSQDAATAKALGDRLADYFDGGGRVVTALFGNTQSLGLGGRFVSGGYLFYQTSTVRAEIVNQGATDETGSPLMNGVSSLSSTKHGVDPALPGGVVVAHWDSGDPLVVRGSKGGRARVDLNVYPGTNVTTGPITRLLLNALLFDPAPCPAIPAVCKGAAGSFCTGAGLLATCAADPVTTCIGLTGVVSCTDGKDCRGERPNAMCACAANQGAACGTCGQIGCDGSCTEPTLTPASGGLFSTQPSTAAPVTFADGQSLPFVVRNISGAGIVLGSINTVAYTGGLGYGTTSNHCAAGTTLASGQCCSFVVLRGGAPTTANDTVRLLTAADNGPLWMLGAR